MVLDASTENSQKDPVVQLEALQHSDVEISGLKKKKKGHAWIKNVIFSNINLDLEGTGDLAGVDSGAPAAQTKKDEPMGLENGLSA